MIISASYRTDIPAFYSAWFLNRLRAGYCKTINPYNRQVSVLSLAKDEVDGFVFWTKNIVPFIDTLEEVRQLGIPFVIQHTVNNYPRALETSVLDHTTVINALRRLADSFGPRTCVWRYDPIVVSSITSRDFHLRNFEYLSGLLRSVTDEVVISFLHIYSKTRRNLTSAGQTCGFTWTDPGVADKIALTNELALIAQANGIRLTLCAQQAYLSPMVGEAHCVDANRLSDIAGKQLTTRIKGNRPECNCFAARDIGDYDTCPHGCVYCYAVQNKELAQQRYKRHDPHSEYLFPPIRAQQLADGASSTPGRNDRSHAL